MLKAFIRCESRETDHLNRSLLGLKAGENVKVESCIVQGDKYGDTYKQMF